MTTMEILVDMIEDPQDNGNYRLNIDGDDLRRLWKAVELDQITIRTLKKFEALQFQLPAVNG